MVYEPNVCTGNSDEYICPSWHVITCTYPGGLSLLKMAGPRQPKMAAQTATHTHYLCVITALLKRAFVMMATERGSHFWLSQQPGAWGTPWQLQLTPDICRKPEEPLNLLSRWRLSGTKIWCQFRLRNEASTSLVQR